MATIARTALAVLILLLAVVHDATARPGDVDRRFGTGGVALTQVLDGGWAATNDTRGRFLVAGGIFRPGVVRFSSRGRRDRGFGNRGVARVPGARDLEPIGIRRALNGIRVAAVTTETNTPPVELLRMRRTGTNGSRAIHGDVFLGPVLDGAQRRDGGAFVLSREAVRAVDPDGRLDTDFAGGTLSLPQANPTRLAVRPDGRLLVALTDPRNGRNTLRQFTRQGTPDPEWAGGGGVRLPFPVDRLKVLRGGDVVAAAGGPNHLVRLARYTRDGRRRRAFGVEGVAGRIRTSSGGRVKDVAQDGRGRLYVLAESRRIHVIAFTRSGRRVLRFGRAGIRRLRLPRFGQDVGADEAHRLLVTARRGLLIVGSRYRGGIQHPKDGCDIRGDLCALETYLAVWRLKR